MRKRNTSKGMTFCQEEAEAVCEMITTDLSLDDITFLFSCVSASLLLVQTVI